MSQWFCQDEIDQQLSRLRCPMCACREVHVLGHECMTKEDCVGVPALVTLQVRLMGTCGHFWMIEIADYDDGATLEVIAAPLARRPRFRRRTQRDRRWLVFEKEISS